MLDKFRSEFIPKLGMHRGPSFERMLEHLLEYPNPVIIETGTARQTGNWAGDGQSTLIWDFYLSHRPGEAWSIDISKENVENARRQTKRVNYVCGDSVKELHWSMPLERCYLLYLDSFDFDRSNPLPSALHHLKELTSAWGRLPSGCLIVVDDCLSPTLGKQMLVKEFMVDLNIWPSFEGYHTGWIKP